MNYLMITMEVMKSFPKLAMDQVFKTYPQYNKYKSKVVNTFAAANTNEKMLKTYQAAVSEYQKELKEDRLKLGMEAKEFFMTLYNANIDKIVVENPIPSKIYGLPKYSQSIQPYEYGHPFQKKTCLWLKNVPELKPTNIVSNRQSTKVPGNWFNKGGKDRQKNRAKTFEGIAQAMAEQWG